VVAVEAGWIEQYVILHGGAAETGIVGDAWDAAIGASNNPVLHGVEFLRRTVGTFDDVAIDKAAGAEERRHAGGDAQGKSGVAEALENELAGEVWIDAFVEGEADVGESVERDGTHHLKMRGAAHG